ncbi:MASE3 domain-containing protein [Mesobacillus sp. AQ2]|uniref:MASE3 domain-containing protein n=1 Tax=Mesobacillus sp. AQ2 TaxID=3043332 RepID=UPI0024C129AE|nr:MASE3 domain-containing protein [Mesobacillus sp. AQ2]WHX40096.1 MASE3 domain-containing protein [Mesobacillus sp. AQ2]
MERSMSEGRFLIYTIAAVMFFMLIHLYHSDLSPYLNPENYIAIHTILEFFSIAVSFSIFSYGWKLFGFTKSRKILMLSFLFFIVGVLDLLHTVTFKGMPFFITESSIAKATWFWVAARVAESLLIVLVLILPERQLKMDSRRICLALCTIVLGTIMYMIFRYEQSLPLLVIEGEGTTLLKNVIEYGVGFLHFISIVISLYFYHEGKDGQHLYVALAFTFLFLSELVFTIYQSVYDIDNFTGHLYKAAGYFFIMRGFYFSTIADDSFFTGPREKVWSQPEEMIQSHYGIIFRLTKQGNDFIHKIVGGGLLEDLGFTPNEINGKTLKEFLPEKAGRVEKYYECVWKNNEKIVFDIEIGGNTYAISLMPVLNNGEVVEIAGAVMGIVKHSRLDRCSRSTKANAL